MHGSDHLSPPRDERGVKRPRDNGDGDSEDGEAHVPMATACAESRAAPEVVTRKHVSFANVLVSEVRCARYDDACSTRDLGGGSEPAVIVEPTAMAVGGVGGRVARADLAPGTAHRR